ncbi:MAG: hypothetical protein JW819_09255, partial [Candidatus Krumholzibacteriota bacterium]|nr:hypothetical protein [Candidatus Krumholzibacteriota bacterium]
AAQARIAGLLDALRAAWPDTAARAACVDPARHHLLAACREAFLREGVTSPFAAAADAYVPDLAAALPPGPPDPARLAVEHRAGRDIATLSALRGVARFATRLREDPPAHAFLRSMLVITVETRLPRAAAPADTARAEHVACSVTPGIPAFTRGVWAGDEALDAWVDSLRRDDPHFRAGGIKGRFLGMALGHMAREGRAVLGAWTEYGRQVHGKHAPDPPAAGLAAAGPPPRCPLGRRALLRLVLLPDSHARHRWRLSAVLLAAPRDAAMHGVILEPGWQAWLARYRAWHERVLEAEKGG